MSVRIKAAGLTTRLHPPRTVSGHFERHDGVIESYDEGDSMRLNSPQDIHSTRAPWLSTVPEPTPCKAGDQHPVADCCVEISGQAARRQVAGCDRSCCSQISTALSPEAGDG